VCRPIMPLLILLFVAGQAQAITLSDKMHSNVSKGNKHYEEGEHEAALGRYQVAQQVDSTQAVPHFNAGDALYRLGKFPEGAQEFLKSSASPSDSVAAMSYYNLGNSLFRAGDLRSAAEAYKRSLLIDPEDEDTKFNLELAMKMIEEQQQQQDQQQQQQDRPEDSQDDLAKEKQPEQQQDQQQQDQQQQQQEQQVQQEPRAQQQDEITPEDLERILAAIEASDKNTQEEMLKQTSRRKRVSGKDW
jgi:Ca-activated chloride channel family protein